MITSKLIFILLWITSTIQDLNVQEKLKSESLSSKESKVLGFKPTKVEFTQPTKGSRWISRQFIPIFLHITEILMFPREFDFVVYRSLGIHDRPIFHRKFEIFDLQVINGSTTDFFLEVDFSEAPFVTDYYFFSISVSEPLGQKILADSDKFLVLRNGVQHDLPQDTPMLKDFILKEGYLFFRYRKSYSIPINSTYEGESRMNFVLVCTQKDCPEETNLSLNPYVDTWTGHSVYVGKQTAGKAIEVLWDNKMIYFWYLGSSIPDTGEISIRIDI